MNDLPYKVHMDDGWELTADGFWWKNNPPSTEKTPLTYLLK